MIAPPPIPEPVDGPLPGILSPASPLQRFALADGWAIEISRKPESVYLLCRSDHTEIPVPLRHSGIWNPATLSGRHFFMRHEPDAAMDLVSVRQADHYIGRLAFPSGWAASPWFSGSARRPLLRRLELYADEFMQERLDRSPALMRATARRLSEPQASPHTPR